MCSTHAPVSHAVCCCGCVVVLRSALPQAVKRRGEAYTLIWPERAEFVRMAAKFGATIVPFAAIGADEAVTTHINGDELERLQKLLPQPPQLPQLPFDLPFLPQQQRKPELSAEERRARIPRARKGVNAMEEDLEAFMSVGDILKHAAV